MSRSHNGGGLLEWHAGRNVAVRKSCSLQCGTARAAKTNGEYSLAHVRRRATALRESEVAKREGGWQEKRQRRMVAPVIESAFRAAEATDDAYKGQYHRPRDWCLAKSREDGGQEELSTPPATPNRTVRRVTWSLANFYHVRLRPSSRARVRPCCSGKKIRAVHLVTPTDSY